MCLVTDPGEAQSNYHKFSASVALHDLGQVMYSTDS